MDEEAYQSVFNDVNPNACVYEKTILQNKAQCQYSKRFFLAEREGVSCQSNTARDQCQQLIELLKENAVFALKLHHHYGELPHAKAIKIQVGGLLGISQLLNIPTDSDPPIANIYQLIQQAIQQYHSLEQLPFSEIMPAISAFKGRSSRR